MTEPTIQVMYNYCVTCQKPANMGCLLHHKIENKYREVTVSAYIKEVQKKEKQT